jgi:hypothetical protein
MRAQWKMGRLPVDLDRKGASHLLQKGRWAPQRSRCSNFPNRDHRKDWSNFWLTYSTISFNNQRQLPAQRRFEQFGAKHLMLDVFMFGCQFQARGLNV